MSGARADLKEQPHIQHGDRSTYMLALLQQLLACAQIQKAHGIRVSLQELRTEGYKQRTVTKLLDRALSPELLLKEVRVHVAPFCAEHGICCDEALQEHVMELAPSLSRTNGQGRLQRAAKLLHCISDVQRRAECLIRLLQHWREAEVPVELRPFVDESESWPSPQRQELRQQLIMLDAQRLLKRYGQSSPDARDTGRNERLVKHLLSHSEHGPSIQHGIESLKDALSIMSAFPQTFTRAEVLFLSLTHLVAEVVGAEDVSIDALCNDAFDVLNCAGSTFEHVFATRCFAHYCIDQIGDAAACIASSESRGFAEPGVSSVRQVKAGSSALCAVAVKVLQRAALLQHRGADASQLRIEQWTADSTLELFMRLQRLQQEFDVFVDPTDLPTEHASCTSTVRTVESASTRNATEIFQRHAAPLLKRMVSEWRSREDVAAAHSRDQIVAATATAALQDDDVGNGCLLTQLLRLGHLLGLEQWRVHEAVIREAASVGLLPACRSAIEELLQSQSAENSADLVGLVKRLLHNVCEHLKVAHRPTEMIHQLTQLEESVVTCISACPAVDIAPLLELVQDLHFATETLLSSDILDTIVDGQEARSHLQTLPVAHRHHLSCLDCADATMQSDGFNTDFDIFPNAFSELQCQLIPGPAATKAILDYLSVKHQAESALSLEVVLSNMLELLRPSDCVELSTALMLRHPGSIPKAVLLQVCRDRSSRVMRAGNMVDHQLAAAYLGCLERNNALEVFSSSLSYVRPGKNPMEHQRLLHLLQLGSDLAVLWGDSGLHAKVSQMRVDPKWRRTLLLLDVPFEDARFDIRLWSDRGLQSNAREAALVYKQSLLPLLIKASHFNLGLALQYGHDYGVPDKEVVAQWIEVCLTMPNSAAAWAAIGSASKPVEQALSASLKEPYRLQVPPVLANLPSQVIQDVLLRILPHVSPYDYGRIGFILGLLESSPQMKRLISVLRILQKYTRISPPREAETQQVSVLTSRLQREQHLQKSESERAADEARHLAKHCLPWHAVALGQDVWATLRPELCSPDSVAKLFPLSPLLNLDPDEFYVSHLRHLEESVGEKPDACSSNGLSHSLTAKDMLLEMQDPWKALGVAQSLEKKMQLGPEQIAIARCRQEILRRAVSGHYNIDVEVRDLERQMSELHTHICLLESRWDLEEAGLSIFQDLLVQHGVKACVKSMYFYLPVLLILSASCNYSTSGLAPAITSAQKMGPLGLHKLVDALCIRHDLSPKTIRQYLIEQWIMNPRIVPEHVPTSLQELHAKVAAEASSGDPAQSHRLLQKSQLMHNGQNFHMFFQTPGDIMCLERVVFVAWPPHDSSSSFFSVTKEAREDAKTRCLFLLRLIFTEVKDRVVPYDAKCRALTVIFRIAPTRTIEKAYRNSLEELQNLWKCYIYMDAFERLGTPQDFKRFFQCSKEGLARSLWRSRQTDSCMVQVIASLCLDYKVIDSHFWAAILNRLHAAHFHSFLRDVLAALHERLASEMPYDPNFVAILRDLVRAPVDAVAAWCKAAGADAVPSLASWLPLLPYVLRRSPFIADLDPSGLALQLLAAVRSPSLPAAPLASLASAMVGQGMHCPSQVAVGHGVQHPAAADRPGAGQPLCDREVAAAPIRDSGFEDAPGSTFEAHREMFSELALEIACCDSCLDRLEAFVREEIVGRYPDLIWNRCLQQRAGSIRKILFQGILLHRLAVEAQSRLPSALFGELAEFAVTTMSIEELMEAAMMHARFSDATRLVVHFSKIHSVPQMGDLLMGSDTPVDGEAAEYLRNLCNGLRGSPATCEAFNDFAVHVNKLLASSAAVARRCETAGA